MNKKILPLLALLFVINNIVAQNIAPLATVSANGQNAAGCQTGACATLNDLNFGTCGTQQMWISTTTPPNATLGVDWIQWDWSSQRVLNRFVIHHAQNTARFLTGATIQTWNGSAWVTVGSFSNLPMQCINTVNFNAVATSRIRITGFLMQGTGQLSNPNFREIEIFGPNFRNDAGVTSISAIDICQFKQKISTSVTNFGIRRLDSFRLHWSVNGVNRPIRYISSSILTGNSITYDLDTAFIFSQNTNYDFRVWTTYPNGFVVDSGAANDLFTSKVEFMGTPSLPTIVDTKQCGQGRAMLKGTPASNRDSILWYTQASGGIPIANGRNVLGPFITQTSTFYGHSVKIASSNTTFTHPAFTGVNLTQANHYGTMFNVTVLKDILMDSLMLRLNYTTPTSMGYQLYYKLGTYAGFQTNASAWTILNEGTTNILTINGATFAKLSAKSLFLYAGNTYSFYVTSDINLGGGNSFLHLLSAPTVSNVDISLLTSGSVILGKFGATSVTANYLPDVSFLYKRECVSSARLPYIVTVKPRPIGASVVKGSTFQGQFRNGTPNDPDVLEIGKTNTYNLIPPTGYINADHGSTWSVNIVNARTKFNVLVPPSEYTVVAPGSGAGTLSFKPKSLYLDSTITFSINISDLGPHFCDSTISRTIYIAPTPKPNFKLPTAACSNNEVFFENTSTIHSGLLTYMWYFGDGDSSDANTPTHTFAAYGTYNVKLRTISDRWLVVKDTTMVLNVGEVPMAKFSLINRCFGTNLSFINNSTVSVGTLSYKWRFGDGNEQNTISSSTIQKGYATAGIYKVTLIADNAGCKDSVIKNAYQFAKPLPNFNLLSGSCSNEPFQFVNTTTIAIGSYGSIWDFNDMGNIATDNNATYTFSSGGAKNVELRINSEFNCTDSITKIITVKQAPEAQFSYPFACEFTPTPFTNLSDLKGGTLQSYTWNFSQGVPVFTVNPTVNWAALGDRKVTLKTMLTNGCSSEITKDIAVGVQPIVDFEFNNQCIGNETVFTNFTTHRIGDINYTWNFDDGSTATQPSTKHTFALPNTYNVKLKANVVGGCSDSITKAVAISDLPATCDFDFARNWNVSSQNFVFTPKTGSATGINYKWLMGDGKTINSNAAGVNYTFDNVLKYCVTMIASNAAGCECSKTKCISVLTDLPSLSNTQFSVFPNPSNGVFNLTTLEMYKNVKVEVYNTLGKKVKAFSFENSNTNELNLTEFATGVYMLKVIANNQVGIVKVNIVR